jgi:hypothetical protein
VSSEQSKIEEEKDEEVSSRKESFDAVPEAAEPIPLLEERNEQSQAVNSTTAKSDDAPQNNP